MKLPKLVTTIICCISVTFLMIGCGKKAEDPKQQSTTQQQTKPAAESDAEDYLANQQVACVEGEVCPNYIVKIVVLENKKPRYCTGFLVNGRTVATSTSCLPQLMRLKDQDCSKDVTFFFPETAGHSQERVACSKVLQVSELNSENAILWRDDVAFLELDKNMVSRRSLLFNRDGLDNESNYTMWGVDQVDEKMAFIRKQSCEALHNSYINPLASKNTSPNMLFAGCELKVGNMGAPIIDKRGRVRGMVSQSIDSKLRSYLESTGLLTLPLREMFHATNFSCAPTIFDTTVEDERECTKTIDQLILDRLRRHKLLREDYYEEKRKELEERVSKDNRFFDFGINLISEGDFKRAEIVPKCFKNVADWIRSLDTSRGIYSYMASLPQVSLKRTMDPNGYIGAIEVDNGMVNYYLQFSVKHLKKYRRSDVHIWKNDTHQVFNSLRENCR